MFYRFFQLLVLLVPLACFALALQPVQELLFHDKATWGILLLLGCLAALALIEGLLFRYWILPSLGDKVAESLYAGTYLPENDALARLVDRIRSEKAVAQLPLLEKLVLSQPDRLRGWLELAHLQHELLDDNTAALQTLETGASHMRDREEAALLLYRAAALCENSMHDSAAARRFYEQAAVQYADTVYGRKAANCLN